MSGNWEGVLFDGLSTFAHHDLLANVAQEDVNRVIEKDMAYRASWLRRGGTGAYHVMARKMDRLDASAEQFDYDIFKALDNDQRSESVLDDIRDLRRYLLLIEARWLAQQARGKPLKPGTLKHDLLSELEGDSLCGAQLP